MSVHHRRPDGLESFGAARVMPDRLTSIPAALNALTIDTVVTIGTTRGPIPSAIMTASSDSPAALARSAWLHLITARAFRTCVAVIMASLPSRGRRLQAGSPRPGGGRRAYVGSRRHGQGSASADRAASVPTLPAIQRRGERPAAASRQSADGPSFSAHQELTSALFMRIRKPSDRQGAVNTEAALTTANPCRSSRNGYPRP